MTTELEDSWTQEADRNWIAGSSVYPRIAVVAGSRAEALARLGERRDWWLNLPEITQSGSN